MYAVCIQIILICMSCIHYSSITYYYKLNFYILKPYKLSFSKFIWFLIEWSFGWLCETHASVIIVVRQGNKCQKFKNKNMWSNFFIDF